MTRVAPFLSVQFARLQPRPATTSPLRPRKPPYDKHHSSAINRHAHAANPPLRASGTTYNNQTLVLSNKNAQSSATWNSSTRLNHSSANSWILTSIAGLLGGLVFYTLCPRDAERSTEEHLIELARVKIQPNMQTKLLPGRPETLTKEQEAKLREFWIATFKLCGISVSGNDNDTSSIKTEKTEAKPKKKASLFRRVAGGGGNEDEDAEEDKYGLNKIYADALKSMTPEEIRQAIWGMVKIDDPDHLLLRFLRARKWDVQRALVMMISTMKWRIKDMHVDDDIMRNGELMNLDEKDVNDPARKKMAKDLMAQFVTGKSFCHGVDKEGRPICIIRVRLHKPGDQSVESLERFTVYQIESTRLMLVPPIDTAMIVFDMTDFGLANMDYVPLKFIIKCFEANYPESLGVILLHKAPWVFQGVWKIIKGWLDPVVAAKVHFTNNLPELQEYIDTNKIIPEMDGEEDWEYKYIQPVPGENDAMKDTVTRDKIEAERKKIVEEYEKTTVHWINSTGEEAAATRAKRTKLAGELKENYWRLDPYIRARSIFDRWGVLSPEGKVNYYPSSAESKETINGEAAAAAAVEEKTEAPNGAAAVDTTPAQPTT